MKTLLFVVLSVILTTSIVYSSEVADSQQIPIELYLVAPQGRLYRAKRQFGNFGASSGQAGSQSFNYSPQGFNAAQSLSGSQSYDFGGHHLSVGYAGSYSANPQGASGSFAPTYSFT